LYPVTGHCLRRLCFALCCPSEAPELSAVLLSLFLFSPLALFPYFIFSFSIAPIQSLLPRSTAAAGSRLTRAPARFSRSSLSYSRHSSVLVALSSESCPQRAEALSSLSITRPSLGALFCRRQVLRSPVFPAANGALVRAPIGDLATIYHFNPGQIERKSKAVVLCAV
jgi:hypothetical protein